MKLNCDHIRPDFLRICLLIFSVTLLFSACTVEENALHEAVLRQEAGTVADLLAQGVDPNVAAADSNALPIEIAAQKGNPA
ncbi:MAG: hypothetical protein AAF570_27700, partial [Bacteroidota bacterium]